MPELPEVITIVSGLNKKVKNLTIKNMWTDCANLIKSHSFGEFKKQIIGKTFLRSEQIGKNILVHLSGGKTLLFHMKMTGHLLYGKWVKNSNNKGKNIWKSEIAGPLDDPYNSYIHVMFSLSNKKQLAYSDVRKFGKIVLLEEGKELNSLDLKKLGPDALDKKLSFKKFNEILSKRIDGLIKQILLNQEVVAGIGNIYSDEILWKSGVHPKERISKLTDEQKRKIFIAMKKILNDSVKLGGDSMSDFRNINGEKGKYQDRHKAYRKTGELCSKPGCTGKIIRIKVGGRSAHFCDIHQKLL